MDVTTVFVLNLVLSSCVRSHTFSFSELCWLAKCFLWCRLRDAGDRRHGFIDLLNPLYVSTPWSHQIAGMVLQIKSLRTLLWTTYRYSILFIA